MGFFIFIKELIASLGLLAIPLFICLSVVFVITIERTIFFLFVFKKENAISLVQDIILKNKLYPKHLREDLLSVELDDLQKSLTFGLNLLKFIASIATMLGLLGTVIGMIDVFSSISEIKIAVSPAVISVGIKKAMYTTAYGLVIAILSLFISHVFSFVATKIFNSVEEYSIILNTTTEYERVSQVGKSSNV